jgi:hypothetical protein
MPAAHSQQHFLNANFSRAFHRFEALKRMQEKTQNGLVSKDTSPLNLTCEELLRLTPLPQSSGAGGGN